MNKMVELVVKIPKEMYERIAVAPRCASDLDAFKDRDSFVKAIQAGTVLPEGHGDLVDLQELMDDFWDEDYMEICESDLPHIEPVIKADKKTDMKLPDVGSSEYYFVKFEEDCGGDEIIKEIRILDKETYATFRKNMAELKDLKHLKLNAEIYPCESLDYYSYNALESRFEVKPTSREEMGILKKYNTETENDCILTLFLDRFDEWFVFQA